jgi:hypothetical protein
MAMNREEEVARGAQSRECEGLRRISAGQSPAELLRRFVGGQGFGGERRRRERNGQRIRTALELGECEEEEDVKPLRP